MTEIITLARFHLLSVWNWRTSYLSRIIEAPAYFLFLVTGLATLSSGHLVDRMSYDDFAYAGVLMVIAIRSLFWSMGDVANDRKWGTYAVSRTADVSFTQYVISILCANGIVALLQIAAIGLLKQGLDHGHPLMDMAMAMLSLLISLMAIVVGCSLGFGINSYSTRDLLTSLFSLPLVMTAPLFYPLNSVPAAMRALAAVNPFTYGVQLVRSPAVGAFPPSAALGCAVTTAVAVVALGVAGRRHELISGEQG